MPYCAITSGASAWVFRVAAPDGRSRRGAERGCRDRPARSEPPVGAFSGAVAAVVGACVVLALRRYFRHRQAVDSRYKALIDQTNDGIVIVDADGYRIQYCNPAFLARSATPVPRPRSSRSPICSATATPQPESVLARLKNADGQPAHQSAAQCKNASQIDVEVRCNRLETDGREALPMSRTMCRCAAKPNSSSSTTSSGWIAWRITIN